MKFQDGSHHQKARPFGLGSILLLSAPMLIYFLVVLGETYKESLPWFKPWHPVVFIVGGLSAASFVQKRRRLRKAGFQPAGPGFSGEIDRLRNKVEERLAEVDRAVRFDRPLESLPREFGEFAREVIQTAMVLDKKQILNHLQSLHERDEWICTHLSLKGADFERELQSYQYAMEAISEELRLYSEDLKRRGGLFKLSRKEYAISVALIVSFTLGGGLLVWRYWNERPWQFWTGVIAIVIAAIVLALLIDVLKNQERAT
jgi:hypothetical protein